MNSPPQPSVPGRPDRWANRPPADRSTPRGAVVTGLLLVVAILSISSSAVLVRYTEAPSLTLSWWRTLGGGMLLAPNAVRWWRRMSATTTAPGSAAGPLLLAGLALGAHFWMWLASLETTSVAASVTLVSTAPFFVVALAWFAGRRPGGDGPGAAHLGPRGRQALTITVAGAVLIGLAGRSSAPGVPSATAGNLLALAAAAAMAVYLTVGDRLRSRARLGTAAYASPVYLVAAGSLTVAAALTGTNPFALDRQDALVVAAMIAGPQLCGHTVLNHLLGRLGAMTIALALLAEPVGATVLAWLVVDERPARLTLLGAALVVGGLAIRLLGPEAPQSSTKRRTASAS